MAQEATECTACTASHTASDSQTLSQHELQSNLSLLKSKARYRTSISTESPMVILTPPQQQEVVREERRLSASVSRSAASDDDDAHLLPPPLTESEPQDVVKQLIHERRPSALQSLSHTIKELFIEKKVKEDGVPALICDGVYLGSIGAAKNGEWLSSHGITHILCVARGIGACFPSQFTYKVVPIDDAPDEHISSHFSASLAFIEGALAQGGKVLVHCFAGASRSVTVVSAYLMHKERIGAVAALKRVRARRAVANPNAGFIVQLIKFQRTLQLQQDEDEDEDEDEKQQHNDDDDDDAIDVSASSLVQKWESGRRPSMLTALAKLSALKKRSRANSAQNVATNTSEANEASEALKSGPGTLSLLSETSTGRSLADVEDVVTPLEEYDADGAFPETPPQQEDEPSEDV